MHLFSCPCARYFSAKTYGNVLTDVAVGWVKLTGNDKFQEQIRSMGRVMVQFPVLKGDFKFAISVVLFSRKYVAKVVLKFAQNTKFFFLGIESY